jgi:hypothetical protein
MSFLQTDLKNKEQGEVLQNSAGEYTFERLTDERLSALQYLYRDAFFTDVSLDFLRKKYDTSAYGLKYTGYVAYALDGSPAAYYGVFPLYVKYKEETILAAQSGDTMTHSRHRGKGLFFSLATEAYKLAKENGVKFVYGFPNKHNSYHGLMKLKWTHDGFINRYRIKVFTFPAAKIAQKIKFLSSLYGNYSEFILRRYESKKNCFENSISDSENIIILRDENYFSYKNYTKKYVLGIEGKNVYIKVDGSLLVGDIEKSDKEKFFKIIKKLKSLAFWLGAHNVVFQLSPAADYDAFLSERYEAEESLPVCYLDLGSGMELGRLKFSMADFDTF